MKKTLPIAIIAASLLGLGSLSSCHDEDLGVSESVLKEKAFEDAFSKQFGKPDPNQSWDFYTQAIEGLRASKATTRATIADYGLTVTSRTSQPAYVAESGAHDYYNEKLPEYQNNYNMGQSQYNLVATGDGHFTISAIEYAGAFETQSDYNFHFFIRIADENGNPVYETDSQGRQVYENASGIVFRPYTNNSGQTRYRSDEDYYETYGSVQDDWTPARLGAKLFDSKNVSSGANPNLSVDVDMNSGTKFYFELQYHQNNQIAHRFYSNEVIPYNYETIPRGNHPDGYSDQYVTFPFSYSQFTYKTRDYYNQYNGPSQLLSSSTVATDEGIKTYYVIGFEDAWEYLYYLDFDYNDVVIFMDGNLPIPESKRFMVEDLEQYDWDYNDVVFDVEYNRVVIRALGGTQPVYLSFKDERIPDDNFTVELHEYMCAKQTRAGKTNQNPKDPATGLYKPINVNAPNGLELDPVVFAQWLDPFDIDEMLALGTQNDIEIIVGSSSDNTFTGEVDVTPKTKIQYAAGDRCPAVITSLVTTKWMKEIKLITTAYPYFYDGKQPAEGEAQTVDDYWFSNPDAAYADNLYTP